MRPLHLLAAVLLAAAPLLTGCATDFATDAPATSVDAVAPAAASPAEANAVLHCAYLNGPNQLNPGQKASYTAGVNSWCGGITGYVTWSIEGDGQFVALPGEIEKSASGPSTAQVRADDVAYGSFVVTASFNTPSYSGSISKTVTVGAVPPPTPTLNLTATNTWLGVRLNWNTAAVPPNAPPCELNILHYIRGEGTVDERTVHVSGGTYTDGDHVLTGGSGLEMVSYRLTCFTASGSPISDPTNTAGGAGQERNSIDIE